MSTDKDFFSEALDPANEDKWVPIIEAQSRPNRENIYRVTIPGMSTQILKAKGLVMSDNLWGPTQLEPYADGLPKLNVSTCYIEQYCPTPTLPTETLSEIYDVEANQYSEGLLSFSRMTRDSEGYWVGVDSDDGVAHSIDPEHILSFSLTPEKP